MICSMTGYGKSEALFGNKKYIVEIKSLNGKNCDLSLKTQIVPRDRELELRQFILKSLTRGSIDLFINTEAVDVPEAKEINCALFSEYYKKISQAAAENGIDINNQHDIVSSLLKMPDVVSNAKEEMDEECWRVIFHAVAEAAEALVRFRKKEGEVLREDLLTRLKIISDTLSEAESYEQERIETIRERIVSKVEEFKSGLDRDRLEQEMIFYMEKLDINEEKVRLRQHCRYFRETMDSDEFSGKKLGFIAQEMGREINTLGSKSNHAKMQICVVRMKDELEKIKEQILNIL